MHNPGKPASPLSQDLTARRQAHAPGPDTAPTLQGDLTWLRDLLQAVPDAVIVVSTAGTMVLANARGEAVLGYSAAELCGQPLDVLIPDRFPHAHWHPLATALTRPTARPVEQGQTFYVRHKTGRAFAAEISLSPFEAPGGRLVAYVIRDITERKRLDARLWQRQKLAAIDTLAGGIAHEFNNILAGLLGFATMLQREVAPDSRAGWYVAQIRQAGRRAKDLAQQIVTVCRDESITREPLLLCPVVVEAMALLRAALPSTVDIQYRFSEPEVTVHASRTQLHGVVMNLGANAGYAMRESGGRLMLGIDPVDIDAAFAAAHPPLSPGPHVRLTVGDTGRGMTSEVMERIFEPFFTTKAMGEGTGLGLAIVHGIVTSHGGAITVASTWGAGTQLAIYLPCLDAPAPPAVDAEPSLPPGSGSVLVVDDEETVALALRLLLESLGYAVVAYSRSLEALEAFRLAPGRFDLALVDQTMPHLTGEDLVQALRQLRPDMPIILCTGFSYVMDAAKARALQIDAFLMKPVDERELATAIQQVLTQRRHMH